MARVKFYLDKRPTTDGRCHIKLSVTHNGGSALFPTDVFIKPEFWDAGNAETDPHIKRTCVGYKSMNEIIIGKLTAVQDRLNELVLNGTLATFETATQIKNHIISQLEGKQENHSTVEAHFRVFIERCNAAGTAGVYRETLAKVAKYHDLETLRFEDITVAWLKNFENRLRKDGLAVNTIARHLRSVRAVYNDAIDYNIVSLAAYPFRRFKITHEKTAKRALTLEQLRLFRDYPCEPSQKKYRDIFMLIFYLAGILIYIAPPRARLPILCLSTNRSTSLLRYKICLSMSMYARRPLSRHSLCVGREPKPRYFCNSATVKYGDSTSTTFTIVLVLPIIIRH